MSVAAARQKVDLHNVIVLNRVLVRPPSSQQWMGNGEETVLRLCKYLVAISGVILDPLNAFY